MERLSKAGIGFEKFPFAGEDGIWAAPGGGRIAWLKDPDGHLLSIAQLD
jgi:hypothetical protein